MCTLEDEHCCEYFRKQQEAFEWSWDDEFERLVKSVDDIEALDVQQRKENENLQSYLHDEMRNSLKMCLS